MSQATEENLKTLAEQYNLALWNDKDLSAIDRFIDPDVVIHSPLADFSGAGHMKQVATIWLKAFPDLKISHELTLQDAGCVSIQWSAEGTHQGFFKGIAPTARRVHYKGVSIFRCSKGLAKEYWAYVDMQHLLDQIA